MTPIKAPGVFCQSSTEIRECGRQRTVIVGIEPGDVVTFRLKGTRRRYALPIDYGFMQAVRLEAERARREKIIARKAKGAR